MHSFAPLSTFIFFQKIAKNVANFYRDFARFCQNIAIFLPKFCNILTKFRWNFAVICPEKMYQRQGVPGSFPGVFQDLQLSEIAPNLQFPELANNCARPAAALRDGDTTGETEMFLGAQRAILQTQQKLDPRILHSEQTPEA